MNLPGVLFGFLTADAASRLETAMSKVRTSLYVESDLLDGIEEAAEEADVSKSEALRRFLRSGLDHEDDLAELIPDHKRVLDEREQIKERNRVRDLRGGFKGRVLDQMRQRWQNGYEVRALRELAVGYRDEARLLFEDDDRIDEALDYIDRVVDAIEDAEDDSDLDRLDPETVLSEYEGVARGRRREEASNRAHGPLAEEAYDLLPPAPDEREKREAIEKLSARTDVTEEAAEEAVRKAADRR